MLVLLFPQRVWAAPVTPSLPACAPVPGAARLRVGVAEDRAPVSWTKAFRLRGVVTDYLQLLPEAGVEVHPMPTAMLRQRLQQGRLDAVMGLPARAVPAGWAVSPPLLEAPDVVISRRQGRLLLGPGDLRGRVVAVLDPLPAELAADAPRAHVVDNAAAALRLLERGTVELVVGNALLVQAARRRWREDPLVVAGVAGTYDAQVFAVAPQCRAWMDAFVRRQTAMTAAQRAHIVARWSAPAQVAPRGDTMRGAFIALLVLAIAGLYLHGYRRLRDEVHRKRLLQQRVDGVTANLPAVVFQASGVPAPADAMATHRRGAARGQLVFLFLAGDTPQLFNASPAALRADPAALWAAIEPAQRMPLLRAILTAARRGEALHGQFQTHGVRGARQVALHAWPADPPHAPPTWRGYWLDVTDADARAQATAHAHARAQRDMHARERLLHRLGEGMRGPMQEVLDRVLRLSPASLAAPQREAHAALEDAAGMLARILDDILAAAPTPGNEVQLHPAPVDLRGLLESVQHVLAPLAAAKALRLTLHCDPALGPWLQVDSTRLRQVLFNLLGNAIKFTERGGVLLQAQVIAADGDAQLIELAVSDTGVGIAPERLQSVFKAFEQADLTISRRFGGTGLGLGISRRLVEAMGGTLELRSVPARGTTAVVRLMLPGRPEPTAVVPGPGPAEPAPSSAQVLVADDHPTHRLLLQWRLRQLGLVAEMAVDGGQAFERWRQGRHALVITDEQMPGCCGGELLRRIRAEMPGQGGGRTAVIGMSAEPSALASMGFDAVLAKPLRHEDLAATIQRLCPGLMEAAPPVATETAGGGPDVETHLQRMTRQFGSEATARELLGSLRLSLEQDAGALEQALVANDRAAITHLLHRIAGGIGSVGMTALAQCVRDLGETAHDPAHAAHQVLPQLQDCVRQLRALEAV